MVERSPGIGGAEAVRLEHEQRRRNRLLTEMLDHLEATRGPVDERLVRKYLDLLA
ncbi:hypothetical protein [Rhabdothermincola sp.]|uniref:hypothetical protein n=1 Tax=Rhabdothermincola sp. TaxID=2820405 RepID=UPI002FE115C3